MSGSESVTDRRTHNTSRGDVLLRDVTESDLAIFFEHQRDPEATRMAAFPARDLDAFMVHWHRIMRDGTVVTKTVVVDGRVAGNMVCFELSGQQEVGYWIGRDHWGKGVATRALMQFLRHVKSRPLHAHVARHNVASFRVLEKCGFTVAAEETEPNDASGDEAEEFVLKLE